MEFKCPQCGKITELDVEEGLVYMVHTRQMRVQDAFPTLSEEEREIILTGICPECWDIMFDEDLIEKD